MKELEPLLDPFCFLIDFKLTSKNAITRVFSLSSIARRPSFLGTNRMEKIYHNGTKGKIYQRRKCSNLNQNNDRHGIFHYRWCFKPYVSWKMMMITSKVTLVAAHCETTVDESMNFQYHCKTFLAGFWWIPYEQIML